MGSDMLTRPEDEDSPEFREYLKQLMKLQMNRAKQGNAAPSSGSSDAYIAKLNRLKVERLALIQAGLPDAPLDTSYKPEDYKAALLEAAEPLVASAVLTGDAAIAKPGTRPQSGRGQVRQLSAEEIANAKSAEEKVKAALERQAALGPMVAPLSEGGEAPPGPSSSSSELDELFDRLVKPKSAKSAPSPPATAPAQPRYQAARSDASAAQVAAPVPPAPVAAAPVAPKPVAPKPVAPKPVPAPPRPAAAAVSASTADKRKLTGDELETAGEAVKFLVRHRGGGPFGTGRVPEEEIGAMEAALTAARAMLEKDTLAAYGPAGSAAPVAPPPRAAPVPVPVAAPAPVKAAFIAPPVQAPAPAPAPAPRKIPQAASGLAAAAASPAAAAENVPIAVGLDQFLSEPKKMDVEELSALRDGLIQVLGMLAGEIASRPPAPVGAAAAGGAAVAASASDAPNLPAKATLEEATQRIASSMTSSGGQGGSDATREAKLALGLLLKHRGGPGFGHGRLDGRDLQMLEEKLRSVASTLEKEAAATNK
jgi:hypothetical protein